MNEQIISQAEPEPAARSALFPEPNRDRSEAIAELERSVRAALETYANVHRGSGHASLVSTALFEHARLVVLDHLGLEANRHTVIFCTPARASELLLDLAPADCRTVSSSDIGLALGVTAVAVRTKSLRALKPVQSGGGTVKIAKK